MGWFLDGCFWDDNDRHARQWEQVNPTFSLKLESIELRHGVEDYLLVKRTLSNDSLVLSSISWTPVHPSFDYNVHCRSTYSDMLIVINSHAWERQSHFLSLFKDLRWIVDRIGKISFPNLQLGITKVCQSFFHGDHDSCHLGWRIAFPTDTWRKQKIDIFLQESSIFVLLLTTFRQEQETFAVLHRREYLWRMRLGVNLHW